MAQQAEVESTSDVGNWVLFATIMASSMALVDSTALNVALPALQADLQTTGVELLWIINGYLLTLASLILIGGSLGDLFGRKRVFAIGISLFMVASLACGLAPDSGFLIVARTIQGIGGALMIPGSLAIIAAYFGPERRGRAIGTWSAVTTLLFVVGPILGGFLAENGLWRVVFLINLPFGVLALVALYLKVPESRDEESTGRIDYPGVVLIVLGLAGLTYGFVSAPDSGFADPGVLGSLLVGVVALLAFVVVESRSDHPMVSLHLFRSGTFTGANLLTLFLYGALSVAILFLTLTMIQAQGYRADQAGVTLTPFALILAGLSPWAGGLVDRYGPRLPLIIGPSITGASFLLLSLVGLTNGWVDYWTTYFPGIVLFGLGMAITVAPLTTTVMGSVATHHAGIASGINNAVARTAGLLAVAILGGLALFTFGDALDARAASIDLSPETRIELRAEAANLGQASVPQSVAADQVDAVDTAIKLAFIDTTKSVLLVCAGMAWLSAIMAAVLIKPKIEVME